MMNGVFDMNIDYFWLICTRPPWDTKMAADSTIEQKPALFQQYQTFPPVPVTFNINIKEF